MDQKIIILIVIVIICSSCIALSVFGGVGGYFLMPDSTTTTIAPTPYSSGSSGSGSSGSGSSGSGSSETAQKPDSSGNTYWDCMIGNEKKGKVPINWGHTSGDGAWACNAWRNECDQKCTAKFSQTQADDFSGSSGSGSSETAQKPNSSGNTYWDCMIGNEKKGKVPINWGHTSGDGAWACNAWRNECDQKCTAKFSQTQADDFCEHKDTDWNIPAGNIPVGKTIYRDGSSAKCEEGGKWVNNWKKYVLIRSRKDKSKCLTVRQGGTDNGANIELWSCNKNDANQRFLIKKNVIKWDNDKNKCFAVYNGKNSGGKNDTEIKTWDCSQTDDNQKFTLLDDNQIQWNYNKDRCLNIRGGKTDNNTFIALWNCDGGNIDNKFDIELND
jgi:hypothetical protein